MITDREVFNDAHLPHRLLHRDPEITQLSREFQPILEGGLGNDALISGPSGVGKTALARYTLDRLEQRAGVETIHLRCLGKTTIDILISILEQTDTSADTVDPAGFAGNNHLRNRLASILERPLIVVLDEAEDVSRTRAVEYLGSIPEISTIAICHDPEIWRTPLDRKVALRFDGDHHIELDRYGVGELTDILWLRANRGLHNDVIERDQLRYIADQVAGVARNGIQTLRSAAEFASERSHEIIRRSDIDDGFERAQKRIRKSNLRSLAYHHQILYAIIHTTGEITSTELHERYDAIAECCYEGRTLSPISERARRYKLQKLRDYGLIEWTGERRHRQYQPVDDMISPPIDIELPA